MILRRDRSVLLLTVSVIVAAATVLGCPWTGFAFSALLVEEAAAAPPSSYISMSTGSSTTTTRSYCYCHHPPAGGARSRGYPPRSLPLFLAAPFLQRLTSTSSSSSSKYVTGSPYGNHFTVVSYYSRGGSTRSTARRLFFGTTLRLLFHGMEDDSSSTTMHFSTKKEMTEENNNEEEDPLKWEKLYFAPRMMQHQRTTASSSSSPSGKFDSRSKEIVDDHTNSLNNNNDGDNNNAVAVTTEKTTSSPLIRVITFDLDNTIWKTSETISDANEALAAHLFEEYGIVERSEKVMGRLFRQYPERYAGVDHAAVAAGNMGSSVEDNSKDDDDQDSPGDDDIVRNVGRSEPQVRATGRLESETNIIGVDENTTTMKTKPVYLTLLRKDAIRSLLLLARKDNPTTTLSTTSSLDLERQIDAAFEVWMEARCQSISKNFVPGAVSTLRRLRSRRLVVAPHRPTTSTAATTTTTTTATTTAATSDEMIYIGAITDGNSDPNRVPELSGMFDFVVRAEDVGASKPDARVYKAAVASLMARLVREGRNVEEFFLGGQQAGSDADNTTIPLGPPPPPPAATYVTSEPGSSVLLPLHWKDIDEDAVEAFSDAVGPWWVHVGDDFFKDVVAAKEFRMRTVWSRELIGGSSSGISSDGKNDDRSNDSIIVVDGNNNAVEGRQRSVSDLANDIAKSDDGILKMSIGPSEYLSQSIHTEFSDAILDRFGDLCDLVLRWQEESTIVSQWNNDNNIIVEAALASEEKRMASDGSIARTHPVGDASKDYKFCSSCGEKLSAAARYCSRCGEKQFNQL